jgi:hypothetical protein
MPHWRSGRSAVVTCSKAVKWMPWDERFLRSQKTEEHKCIYINAFFRSARRFGRAAS